MRVWCARQGLSTATLCAWRRAFARGGLEGLHPRRNPRNPAGRTHRHYSPEERRATLDAYRRSGMTQQAFCRLWGLSVTSLARWRRAHREHGPRGLESPWGGARRGRKKQPVPAAVREEIVATKRRFPDWGLRRIRDALARFGGVRVGVHRVREVVREEGLATPVPAKKPRRAPPKVRRFERSRPREMWQSDITSYVLARHSQRVYLTVFLDDHSRYVVSWALALQQRSELVTECLLEGLARFGKPKEVLTDQGRQYFAWRGKSRFQKLLIREGIQHVVSRAHHPQTLGKCERLWQTVGQELWERARPQDLEEARRRLGHFFAHYNHFRPHQGIEGLVPADRFFGAADVVRAEMERRMDQNALALALGDPPRREVLLYGQIDGEAVALHGERGRLVIQRPGREREEIGMAALGAPGGSDEQAASESTDEPPEQPEHPDVDNGRARGEPSEASGPASSSDALEVGPAPTGADAGAGGECDCGRAAAGARERLPYARVLAGQDEPDRGGGQDGCDAAAGLADEPVGGFGAGLWATPATALAEGTDGDTDRSGERPEGAAQGERATAQGTRRRQAADRSLEDAAWQRGSGTLDARGAGEAEGEPVVATGRLPRPQASGAGERRQQDPGDDSTPWWEYAWGDTFAAGERAAEREQ